MSALLRHKRICPLCNGKAGRNAFPYATLFNSIMFSYLECDVCRSVFVDPVPDGETLARMYAKAEYHDCHYEDIEQSNYTESARLLTQYSNEGASALDYGCGTGAFLVALSEQNFLPYGVEFDKDAARRASHEAACTVLSLDDFMAIVDKPKFDVIHFGDVLEHLVNPAGTLSGMLQHLSPGGILFAEGPLEINPSAVYWFARSYGAIKRILRLTRTGNDAPTHLFRTGAKQQLDFFLSSDQGLSLKYWQVYETGWPYAEGGLLKRGIATLAMILGGHHILGSTFGNRFRGVFVYKPAGEPHSAQPKTMEL